MNNNYKYIIYEYSVNNLIITFEYKKIIIIFYINKLIILILLFYFFYNFQK